MRINLNIKYTTMAQHKSDLILSKNSIQRSTNHIDQEYFQWWEYFIYISCLTQKYGRYTSKKKIDLWTHSNLFANRAVANQCALPAWQVLLRSLPFIAHIFLAFYIIAHICFLLLSLIHNVFLSSSFVHIFLGDSHNGTSCF